MGQSYLICACTRYSLVHVTFCSSSKQFIKVILWEKNLTGRKYRAYITTSCKICGNITLFESFGGKRALGFLLKSELCKKRSKFRMQFCLRVSNNALHVFPLKFACFLKYYVCEKKTFFQGHSLGIFCSMKNKRHLLFC